MAPKKRARAPATSESESAEQSSEDDDFTDGELIGDGGLAGENSESDSDSEDDGSVAGKGKQWRSWGTPVHCTEHSESAFTGNSLHSVTALTTVLSDTHCTAAAAHLLLPRYTAFTTDVITHSPLLSALCLQHCLSTLLSPLSLTAFAYYHCTRHSLDGLYIPLLFTTAAAIPLLPPLCIYLHTSLHSAISHHALHSPLHPPVLLLHSVICTAPTTLTTAVTTLLSYYHWTHQFIQSRCHH